MIRCRTILFSFYGMSISERLMITAVKNNLNFRIALFVVLIFLMTSKLFSYTDDKLAIRRFDQLENVEINYNYPDFHHPVFRLYDDVTGNSVLEQSDASKIARFNLLNEDSAPEEDDQAAIKQNEYTKRIVESITKNRYIISIAMLHQNDSFIYGNFKNDLLLWKEFPEGFELVAIYPEILGGCLFCGAQFVDYSGDTLAVEFNGKGLGEEWGGKVYFTIKGSALIFLKNERYRKFIPTEERNNPVPGAYSWVIERFFYNEKGRKTHEEIHFDARNPDNTPVKLQCLSDSLDLYQASVNYLKAPLKYIMTAAVNKGEIRVGPVQGTFIPIYWDGNWYITPKKNMLFPAALNN